MITISSADLEKEVIDKKVLIDTNIIIYLTDKVEPYKDLSRLLFTLIEEENINAIISVVSIAEVMQGPLKKGLTDNALRVKEYLLNFPNMSCQMINEDILEIIGIDDRINWAKLRTIDSLIIASGLKNQVDKIVSNDLHFKQAVSKDILVSFDTQ
ncbi:type II toxin-antitoxin system VapC family toxin [bacterium]|nr:type II toxin-antitoxin system VapC family toxin [bacterium]